MDALWIGVALVVAVAGGWPVTAGILKFARSKTVQAVDDAESGTAAAPVPATEPDVGGSGPAASVAAVPNYFPEDATPESPAPQGPESPAPQGPEAPAGADPAPRPRVEVLRGGLLIGFLERAAVAVAIFSGQPVAIAYVVAIKGLGRYPELKDTPAASERFIIGTLASMLWAASVAAVTQALLL
ncbi:MAG: hypothetical protein ABIN10_04470 [Specibacter sp.]